MFAPMAKVAVKPRTSSWIAIIIAPSILYKKTEVLSEVEAVSYVVKNEEGSRGCS